MSWVIALFGIVLLIILHELGHFLAAKAVGMRVERFSLFFPPRIAGVRRGETEYAIGAIPAGGYVKITGMNPDELRQLDLRVADRAYYNKAPWRRIVVILAGPGVNLLIAFLLFWLVLVTGNVNGVLTLSEANPHVRTLDALTATVGEVDHGMPANGVLRAGDRILTVDGRKVDAGSVVRLISSHRCAGPPRDHCPAARPATLTVWRAGHIQQLTITPRYDPELGRMVLGFRFAIPVHSYGPLGAAGAAVGEMWGMTEQTFTGLAKALTSSRARSEVSSIVGVSQATERAVASGAGKALVVVGYVSLVLAVLNLLPFLPLDGGHVLWSVAEKVRGRRVSLAAMWRFSSVGMLLLLFLVISGFSNDIGRIGG